MSVLRFDGTQLRDPALHTWLHDPRHVPELAAIARHWFDVMRDTGDEVRELFHDGNANACLGDAPFAYVGIFTAHVNVGFFQGASLPDPDRLLLGTGKYMRHVKLKPPVSLATTQALTRLIEAAFIDMKNRVENGPR
jgi:hypothetical protein